MTRINTVVYSRGFVGAATEATYSKNTKPVSNLLTVFNFKESEELQYVVTNEKIVSHYNQMLQRQVNTADFEWREEVIRNIFRAFGTSDVLTWIRACESSPVFTQTHADFIADWIRFCATGRRTLNVNTWERMVSVGVADPNHRSRVCPECIAMIPSGYSYSLNLETPHSNMHNLIGSCLSKPGGFTDLLVTAYVLFGTPN